MTVELAEPAPDDVALIQQVFQFWQQNNHARALELMQARMETGEAWAHAFFAWLNMQQGAPDGYQRAAPYALRAAQNGCPWVAYQLFNNAVQNIGGHPQLMSVVIDLAPEVMPWVSAIDPVGQGWNAVAQGHADVGARLITLRMSAPFYPRGWDGIVASIQEKVSELESTVTSAADRRTQFDQAVESSLAEIAASENEIKTSAGQANLLITTIVSESATTLYEKAAKRNEKDSKPAWTWGLRVLAAAAFVAVMPLIIHYVGGGPEYTSTALVGAHLASTLALASFAGVLLARARSRDLSTQRNYDLATAMGTMVAYSAQIVDTTERQKFLALMGQLVLQANLSGGQSGASEESLAGLVAFANLAQRGQAKT